MWAFFFPSHAPEMKQRRLKFCCTAVVQHPIKEQGVPEKKTRGELKKKMCLKEDIISLSISHYLI